MDCADVTVDDEDHVKEMADRVEASGLAQYSLVEFAERRVNERHVDDLSDQFIVLALTALVVAALGITNTLVMSVLERTHEIGVMKAVGARDGHVLGLFLVEGRYRLARRLLWVCCSAGWRRSPAETFALSLMQRQGESTPEQSLFAFPLVVGGGRAAVRRARHDAGGPVPGPPGGARESDRGAAARIKVSIIAPSRPGDGESTAGFSGVRDADEASGDENAAGRFARRSYNRFHGGRDFADGCRC